ncbi:MAG: hypothetical protein NTZ64_15865, partial [Polaromonas sp.]|nr:hypothetical protein [Polaromonas sp.]
MAMSSTLSESALREPALEPASARAAPPPPAAAESGPLRYGVLAVPRLVAGKTSPRFSLVLMLSRAPVAGEDSIRPLLLSSYLGMELDYRAPAPAADSQSVQTQPFFARQAQMSLQVPGQPAFAKAVLGTPLLRGALHTPLTRDQTLAVLDALSAVPGTLELKAHIEYRASAQAASFSLDIDAADLWDQLKAVAVDGALSEDALQQVFGQLDLPPEAQAAFRRACKSVLLPDPDFSLLGRRPAPGSRRLHEEWQRDTLEALEVSCPLEAVLGNALSAADWAACISIVGPSGNLDGGPLLETLTRSSSRARRGSVGIGAMMAGNKIQTVAATL